ncbi:MAG: tyrosine-type recombinase/integrase [Chloroflexi bacterium]|nr:tyrosine-type recombinase/integrase [Chloroflexota bacterium]
MISSTINEMAKSYLSSLRISRSPRTASTYKNAINYFLKTLNENKIDPNETPVSELQEDYIVLLASALSNHAATTERLYITAVYGFYSFLAAENFFPINLPRLKLLIQQRARRPGQRLPQFPASSIETILDKISLPDFLAGLKNSALLINLRDKAFLLTLADTGLRVHEACNLRRGDLDWNEGKAMIIGKGNRQDIVRFSTRSTDALLDYLKKRMILDGGTKIPLSALPIFARHDRGSGKKIKPITTTSGRNIVISRVLEFLGPEAVGSITPHSFRHYFVTRVLRASGNLKLAQELARHKNITVTQRYVHLSNDELDKGYWDAIEE